MPILKQKTGRETKLLRVRIPATLMTEIEALKLEAGQAGFVLDTGEIVERALTSAVRTARIELRAGCQAE